MSGSLRSFAWYWPPRPSSCVAATASAVTSRIPTASLLSTASMFGHFLQSPSKVQQFPLDSLPFATSASPPPCTHSDASPTSILISSVLSCCGASKGS